MKKFKIQIDNYPDNNNDTKVKINPTLVSLILNTITHLYLSNEYKFEFNTIHLKFTNNTYYFYCIYDNTQKGLASYSINTSILTIYNDQNIIIKNIKHLSNVINILKS